MDTIDTALGYIFTLSVILILVAYFAGFVADAQAFTTAINTLGLTFTGRNAQGQFAGYPTGAPAA